MASSRSYELCVIRADGSEERHALFGGDPGPFSVAQMDEGFELEDGHKFEAEPGNPIEALQWGCDEDMEEVEDARQVYVEHCGEPYEGWVTLMICQRLHNAVAGRPDRRIYFRLYETDPMQGKAKFSKVQLRQSSVEAVHEI